MAVIDLTVFGGLLPKDSVRTLPNESAQTASNLYPQTKEFRPLADDTTVVSNSGVSGPLSIYRMQRNSDGTLNTVYTSSSNWKTSAKDKSYVHGKVNSDTTERTYVTTDDGSAAMHVIDASSTDRVAGVPAPTTAATLVVNAGGAGDLFFIDERGSLLQAALNTAMQIIRENATPVWRGADHPGTGTDGYVDWDTTYNFPSDDGSKMVREFRLSGAGSKTISDTYVGSTTADQFETWVFDSRVGGFEGVAGASPSWAGTGNYHWGIPFYAYGLTYDLDTSTISTALAAMLMPGKDDGTKLFTAGQITDLIAQLVTYTDADGPSIKPKIEALAAAVHALQQTLDNGLDGNTATATITGVANQMIDCANLSADITGHYVEINNRLAEGLTDFYLQEGIDAVVPTGVVRVVEKRCAFYTYVNDWGEESAPSPASTLEDVDQSDTATYTAAAPPSGRNITTIRWYRSRSTNLGPDSGFVADVTYDSGTPSTLTYLDEKLNEELVEPCPSMIWDEPPSNLVGIVDGHNGVIAGFRSGTNTACFSEAFKGYAWPEDYRKTTAWPIIGIGHFNETFVLLTRGKPYYVSGPDAASLDSRQQDINQACVAKRGIVSTAIGVFYPSPDGICLADEGGVKLISTPWFDRASWQALTPANIFAAEHDGSYLFAFTGGSVVYMLTVTGEGTKLTTVVASPTTFFNDLITDTLYFAQGTAIKSMFTAGTKRTATWKSKKMQMPKPANLGWLQVQSDFASNVTVKLYREGTLTDTKTVSSRTPIRVSSKYAVEHEVQVEAAVTVTRVTLASTMAELNAI